MVPQHKISSSPDYIHNFDHIKENNILVSRYLQWEFSEGAELARGGSVTNNALPSSFVSMQKKSFCFINFACFSVKTQDY